MIKKANDYNFEDCLVRVIGEKHRKINVYTYF